MPGGDYKHLPGIVGANRTFPADMTDPYELPSHCHIPRCESTGAAVAADVAEDVAADTATTFSTVITDLKANNQWQPPHYTF